MRKDYKDFSLRMSSSLLLGGCFEETSLRVFFLNGHTYFVGMRGIYTGVRMEYEESIFPK